MKQTRNDQDQSTGSHDELVAQGFLSRLASGEFVCSNSFAVMARRHTQIFEFLFFSLRNITIIDETRMIAATALAKSGEPEHQKMLEKVEQEKGIKFKEFKEKYAHFVSENMIIRLVDNFLNFLSESVKNCVLAKPDLLKSKETVEFEEIMNFKDYNELIIYLVDKKINELSYGGMKKIAEFLATRTKINLWESDDEKALLSVSIELRNIYTHNRGVVSAVTLRRLAKEKHPFSLKAGKRFYADFDDILVMANNMFAIALRLDSEVTAKFHVETKSFGEWPLSPLLKA
jgi:hypothetical protein